MAAAVVALAWVAADVVYSADAVLETDVAVVAAADATKIAPVIPITD